MDTRRTHHFYSKRTWINITIRDQNGKFVRYDESSRPTSYNSPQTVSLSRYSNWQRSARWLFLNPVPPKRWNTAHFCQALSNLLYNQPHWALGSAVERFPDKKEVDGPTPSAPTVLLCYNEHLINMSVIIETETIEGSHVIAVIKGLTEKVASALLSLVRPNRDTFVHQRDQAYGGGTAIFNAMADQPDSDQPLS